MYREHTQDLGTSDSTASLKRRMKHFRFEQKNLWLLPFTVQSFPKALGLREVGGHQGRGTQSMESQRRQWGKNGKGHYYSPDLSFIPNADIVDPTDHTLGDLTTYILCLSSF